MVRLRFANTANSPRQTFDEIFPKLCHVCCNFQTRWWFGFGPRFFRSSAFPKEIDALLFNGDANFRVQIENTDLLCAVGGTWNNIIAVVREIKLLAAQCETPVMAIDIGYDCGTNRGHSGFVDGTSNLQELSSQAFEECVLVQPEDDPAELQGSYLVLRKYEEIVELWEDLPEAVQEQIIGRHKESGLFIGQEADWTPKVASATHQQAHIRLANPRIGSQSWRDRIYRRSISFVEPQKDGIRCGLLFIALCRSPQQQVMRIHNERMLPLAGPEDLLLSSGYIIPLLHAIYFLPYKLPFTA
jgi:Dyp-type peroxidase family